MDGSAGTDGSSRAGKKMHTPFRLDSGKGGSVYLFFNGEVADKLEAESSNGNLATAEATVVRLVVDDAELPRSHPMNGRCCMHHIVAVAQRLQLGRQVLRRVPYLNGDIIRGEWRGVRGERIV